MALGTSKVEGLSLPSFYALRKQFYIFSKDIARRINQIGEQLGMMDNFLKMNMWFKSTLLLWLPGDQVIHYILLI